MKNKASRKRQLNLRQILTLNKFKVFVLLYMAAGIAFAVFVKSPDILLLFPFHSVMIALVTIITFMLRGVETSSATIELIAYLAIGLSSFVFAEVIDMARKKLKVKSIVQYVGFVAILYVVSLLVLIPLLLVLFTFA